MARRIWLIIPIFALVHIHTAAGDEAHAYCAFTDNVVAREKSNGEVTIRHERLEGALDRSMMDSGLVLADNHTVQCPEQRDSCYTLWLVDPSDKQKTTMLIQGCWVPTGKDSCKDQDCVSSHRQQQLNNTRFCCCHGDMCNRNVTDNYIPGQDDEKDKEAFDLRQETEILDPNYKEKTIIIAMASICSVSIVIILFYLGLRLYLSSQKQPPDSLYLVEAPSTPSFELDQLKLCMLLTRGRFGEVWRGTLGELDVAVKVFTSAQKQYYANEKDIYTLPHMDPDALPRFYGTDERLTVDGVCEFLLVMSFVPLGTLTGYLKNNVLDWATMSKMAHSVASGLAHLHSDIIKDDKVKVAVAHRDFNSRNILVRDDLRCVICDFGFAMKISGHRFYRNGVEENAEQASLSDVGTLRYMPPEVLEGAVNLRDCEASLKQIDVYALGLVLWEVGSRCADLYQGCPVPEYQLPFQAQLGEHPSFDNMQEEVTHKKSRPLFPDVWKDTNQAVKAFKDTIEDCWDQDAEARLTSMCVEERILDMMTLWENRHKGVTPTMLAGGALGELEDKGVIQRNATASSHPPTSLPPEGVAAGTSQYGDGNINMGAEVSQLSDSIGEPPHSASGRRSNRFSFQEHSTSTSTVETTLSPSDPGESSVGNAMLQQQPTKANCNAIYARNSRAFQPHQGQNPTVARNTHKCSDEELAVLGNTLVSKAQAAAAAAAAAAASASDKPQNDQQAPNTALTNELMIAIADNLESSLVQNDMLNQQQIDQVLPPHPHPHPSSQPPQPQQHQPQHQQQHQSLGNMHAATIPYLQNQVHLSEPLVVRPKQPNVPSNGSGPHAQKYHSMAHNEAKPKTSWFGRFKRGKGDQPSAMPKAPVEGTSGGSSKGKFGLSLFAKPFLKGSEAQYGINQDGISENTPLRNAVGHAQNSSHSNLMYDDPGLQSAPSNLDPRPPVGMEVYLQNGNTVVRPTSLPLSNHGNRSAGNSQNRPDGQLNSREPRFAVAEVGVAKLENALVPNHEANVLMGPKSHSSVDLSPGGSSRNALEAGTSAAAAASTAQPPEQSRGGGMSSGMHRSRPAVSAPTRRSMSNSSCEQLTANTMSVPPNQTASPGDNLHHKVLRNSGKHKQQQQQQQQQQPRNMHQLAKPSSNSNNNNPNTDNNTAAGADTSDTSLSQRYSWCGVSADNRPAAAVGGQEVHGGGGRAGQDTDKNHSGILLRQFNAVSSDELGGSSLSHSTLPPADYRC